ncbi:MAG: bifunctional 5,10-methylenetetrahydrofolate dehydrogenase/5,10-methenyltetrahydrofolate cyclohydrolase [Candidatus Niyogibacteria bacterium]|nr:bifunctional 5,10-methylenetetrahydrofolate dehydrogenase/5,10-methenyltetrahydrofolate cyclohydrolase [Candidatus Niyogibacteria bacterium]
MIVGGKAIAEEIRFELKNEIQAREHAPRLDIILAGDDPASAAYVKRKQVFGKSIGAEVVVHETSEDAYPDSIALIAFIKDIVQNPATDGIIVQLPLPESLRTHTRSVLDAVPPEKDVDCLSSGALERFASRESDIRPPSVGVVDEIFRRHSVDIRGKKIALVGATGGLVGRPLALWFSSRGIPFSAVNTKTPPVQMREILKNADIVISGVGKAGLITADMVKAGVIAIDAGTSSSFGTLRGDMDPAIALKAELFTPVPGGVGPITVAMLFRNLLALANKSKGSP